MQTIYADGIENIKVIDGIVRLDLVNVTEMNDGQAQLRSVAAVALSVPALVRTHQQLSKLINDLVQAGVLKQESPLSQPTSIH